MTKVDIANKVLFGIALVGSIACFVLGHAEAGGALLAFVAGHAAPSPMGGVQ